MSLDPLTPRRHSLRDSAHRGVSLPIGVSLCVYLILLPVPSGACIVHVSVRACPATAQCEFPSIQPQFINHSPFAPDCFNLALIGRASAIESKKREGEEETEEEAQKNSNCSSTAWLPPSFTAITM